MIWKWSLVPLQPLIFQQVLYPLSALRHLLNMLYTIKAKKGHKERTSAIAPSRSTQHPICLSMPRPVEYPVAVLKSGCTTMHLTKIVESVFSSAASWSELYEQGVCWPRNPFLTGWFSKCGAALISACIHICRGNCTFDPPLSLVRRFLQEASLQQLHSLAQCQHKSFSIPIAACQSLVPLSIQSILTCPNSFYPLQRITSLSAIWHIIINRQTLKSWTSLIKALSYPRNQLVLRIKQSGRIPRIESIRFTFLKIAHLQI